MKASGRRSIRDSDSGPAWNWPRLNGTPSATSSIRKNWRPRSALSDGVVEPQLDHQGTAPGPLLTSSSALQPFGLSGRGDGLRRLGDEKAQVAMLVGERSLIYASDCDHHPAIDVDDQSGFLGDRDHFGRRMQGAMASRRRSRAGIGRDRCRRRRPPAGRPSMRRCCSASTTRLAASRPVGIDRLGRLEATNPAIVDAPRARPSRRR